MKIYYKLNLLIISLLVILTVLVAGSVNIMVGQALEEEMQDKELAIAEYMAFTLADPLLNRDVVRVRAIIDDLMMQNADVRYIYVVGFDGTVVAHTFEGGFPVAFVTANPIPDGENTALRSLSVDGGSVRDVGVRLIDGMAAKVYIGFGMTRLVENTERITHTIIGIATLILLFGVSLSFFLTRRMIKHIESLAAGTKRVGGGDLDFRIDVASRDELGMLTDSFNQMTVECKRAEEALRTSKEIQDAILSTTDVLLAYLDREFNFIAVNQAYADAGRRRREDFVGKNHFDLYPHAENEQIFRKAVETGVTQVFSAKPFEYPDQPERGPTWWDWSLIPLKDGSGSVQALVFSLLDVTKRVRAEEDLQESEQNFRDLVENLMDGVAIADENAYHIYVNPKFSEITGYSRDELLNMTGWQVHQSGRTMSASSSEKMERKYLSKCQQR